MAEPSSSRADDPDDPSASNPNFATALQSVPIPSMYLDDDFTFDFTLPEGLMADLEFDGDEGFDFSLDDLLVPSHIRPNHQFELGSLPPYSDPLDPSGSAVLSSRVLDSQSPDSGSSRVLDGDLSGSGACDQISVAPHSVSVDRSGVSSCPDSIIRSRVLDSPSPNSGRRRAFDQDPSSSGAGDQRSDVDMVLNLPLLDWEPKGRSDSGSSDRPEVSGSGTVSSHVSADWKSDSVRVLNSPSPDSSCSTDRHPSVDSMAIDQRIKLEEVGKEWSLKRKKETEDGNHNPNPNSNFIPNARSSKVRRSLVPAEDAFAFHSCNEEEEKKKARLMRNRESAQLSRQRKKHYVEELEDKVRSMHSTIAELNSKISFIMAENASLRQQVGSGGGGICLPPPGVYLPPPIAHYPWVPCSSYAMKPPQGSSQVPLIPIPRLKPQQPISAPKAKSRTKKVASVSFLGLVFLVMIFGGLIPVANLKFGGIEDSISSRLGLGNSVFMGQYRGKVLTVTGGLNRSDQRTGKSFRKGDLEFINCRGEVCETEVTRKKRDGLPVPGNKSEPLVASLYVPRNDKLVKIDGNLIIHSVLASEKAMASSHVVSSEEEVNKTSLAIPNNLALALAVSKPVVDAESDSHMHGSPNECQKALGSGSKDRYSENLKSSATDGPLQQWFREGLAGPILSSGMCTEVFQFEVSPASAKPGAIVPATSSVANISPKNSSSSSTTKRRNRRILFHPPISLSGSTLNTTEEHIRKSAENGHFQGNKSSSSMVVSLLVDPRDAGDGDGDGMILPNSLSRIFVVVLMDSVKYVTYSCVLPLKGSGPQLVTT